MHEKIKKEEAEEYTKSINGIYRCVSALNSTGINELFLCVGKTLLNFEPKELPVEEPSKQNNKEFTLKKEEVENKDEKKKKKKCC